RIPEESLSPRGVSAIANVVFCTSRQHYSTIMQAETVRERVLSYICQQYLLPAGERIAVAVSGGADSVALLRVLLELRVGLGIVISVAHFHHQIRGADADADHNFVAGLAAHFQLEFHSGSADVPQYARDQKVSLESAARELRHRWFRELIEQRRADKIATAH